MKLQLFTAAWCPPCKVIKKSGMVDKFKAKHPEFEVEVIDVDSEEGSEKAEAKNIKSIPTFVTEDGRSGSGLLTVDALEKFLNLG